MGLGVSLLLLFHLLVVRLQHPHVWLRPQVTIHTSTESGLGQGTSRSGVTTVEERVDNHNQLSSDLKLREDRSKERKLLI